MNNRWNDIDASRCRSRLSMRAYSSQLIGSDTGLVLHGGGNTSVKGEKTDLFGQTQSVIWVKGSGFDMAHMGEEGFTALDLYQIKRLATLDTLSDKEMVDEVMRAQLQPAQAKASIEAIVHALIPATYVDHAHPNAILTLSNTPVGRRELAELFGSSVLVLPYVKPGFDLARQFHSLPHDTFSRYEGIILEHHGLFTWDDDAKASYERMIEIVSLAEDWLRDQYGEPEERSHAELPALTVAETRKAVSNLAGRAVVSLPCRSVPQPKARKYCSLLNGGTLTPEHVIHNRPFPAWIEESPVQSCLAYKKAYNEYLIAPPHISVTALPPSPHWAIFHQGQCRSFGATLKRATVSRDIADATTQAMYYADQMDGWEGLTLQQLREMEYWELEQDKLKRQPSFPPLSGRVAVVSGAAKGIGRACAKALAEQGAVVVGLDINPDISKMMNSPGFDSVVVNLADGQAVNEAVDSVVQQYGGIDILVSNAGIFRAGSEIESLDPTDWSQSLDINLTSHQMLLKTIIPYLKHGYKPSVIFIGSRNVQAPGAGAAAYSVSKAGLIQLMRVAALELAPLGIRVNAINPDAVFDTDLWTTEALATSAKRYGLTVEEYKTRNLMKEEVKSDDVARAVVALAGDTFPKTTGAQIPVNGGNERCI